MHTIVHERPYLSITEVAVELGVSAETVRRKIKRGDFPQPSSGDPAPRSGSRVPRSRSGWRAAHGGMNLALHIPYRDRDTPLDAESIWQLPKLLDGEDALVTRELLAISYRAGARTVGQVIDIVECLDAADRRLYIDACRKRAGLKTATEIDDRAALELAQSAGRVRGAPLLQTCHHPAAT